MRRRTTRPLAGLLLAVVLTGCAGADDAGSVDTTPSAREGTMDEPDASADDAAEDGDDVAVPAEDERAGIRVREGTVTHLEGDVAVGVYSLRGQLSAELSVATPDASEDIELSVGDRATVGSHTIELLRVSGGGANVEVVDAAGDVLDLD